MMISDKNPNQQVCLSIDAEEKYQIRNFIMKNNYLNMLNVCFLLIHITDIYYEVIFIKL